MTARGLLALLGRLLGALGGSATRLLFCGVFLGLAVPPLAALCRPLLAPAVLAILLVMLLRLDWLTMLGYARRPRLIALLGGALMLAAPLAVWLALLPLGLPPALMTAIVLMTAAPPILAASSLMIFLGLNSALAILASTVCTLVAPLTLPPLALALLGLELEITVADFMLRLVLIIGSAFAGAALLRRLAGPARLAAHARKIDGLMVLLMLVFAVAVMDGVTATLLAEPGRVLAWLAAAFAANIGLQLLGALAFARLGRRTALSAGLLFGNRNMGLLLAALPADSDPGVALFMAVGQIPMYTLPALLLPLYRRILALRKAASG